MQVSIRQEPYKLRISGLDLSQERWIGTLLTLSNGRLGVRGEFELIGSKSNVSFHSHLYNDVPIWRRELVALPAVNNVYLSQVPGTADYRHVERLLDMKQGILVTRAEVGGTISYSSESLTHRTRKNLFMQHVRITSSNEITVALPVENSLNPFLYNYTYTEHLLREKVLLDNDELVVYYKLRGADVSIEIREKIRLNTPLPDLQHFVTRDSAGFIVRGRNIDIERYLTFYVHDKVPTHKEVDPVLNWSKLLAEHVNAWSRLWEEIGLEIEGPEEVAGAITFYTYHLLQLINEDSEELMIPARGLHGIGYRGHVFWDTDLYLLPFLSLIYPKAMRKVLNFRCRTLDKALEYALETGHKGARYPWESVDQGFESTPRFYPTDLNKCECISILTGEQEIHVTGDIAFATAFYYRVTNDEDFLRECGLRILIETARFWTSRAEFDPAKEAYVIRGVIGPDEYYVGVDNNFYTNLIAKYNLEEASRIFSEALRTGKYGDLLKHLNVNQAEVEEWKKIAKHLFLGRVRDGVFEEFEGFFEKAHLSKQADAILALLLKEIIEGVSPEILEKNYRYYLERTTHESSLSLPIFATVALILGLNEGWDLFLKTLETDLRNTYRNTHEGFHVATAGGLWYAILFGILGIRLRNKNLVYSPKKISNFRLAVNINYVGSKIRVATP